MGHTHRHHMRYVRRWVTLNHTIVTSEDNREYKYIVEHTCYMPSIRLGPLSNGIKFQEMHCWNVEGRLSQIWQNLTANQPYMDTQSWHTLSMSEASVRQCFGYPTPRHMPKTERLAKGAVMLSGIVSTKTTWYKSSSLSTQFVFSAKRMKFPS